MVLGIRQKFIVLCGLVGALLAVVSLLGYFMAYRALDASIKGEITASMASEQRDLAGWVKEHVRISEDLANHAADLDAKRGFCRGDLRGCIAGKPGAVCRQHPLQG